MRVSPANVVDLLSALTEVIQSPSAVAMLLFLLLMLCAWLVYRFYRRDKECQESHNKLEVMLTFLWGLLGQDDRFAGKLPSYQAVKDGRVHIEDWLASPAWHRKQASRANHPHRRAADWEADKLPRADRRPD